MGWEVSGWLKNDPGRLATSQDVGRTLGNGSLVALFYPRATSGTFVKAGVGFAYSGLPPRNQPICPVAPILVALDCIAHQDEGALARGLGLTGGVGHDFRIPSNMSITPELRFAVGRPGDLKSGGESVATGWEYNIVAFDVGVTFH